MNAGNSSSPCFTLTLPNEFLTYNVRVAAVNTQGRAQSSVLALCPGIKKLRKWYDMIRVHCCVQCDDLEKLMSINTAVTSGDRTFRSVDLLQLLQNLAGCNSNKQ